MPKLNMVQALNLALEQEMERDDSVLVMGEDVGKNGGVFRVTDGLYDRFGEKRVIDTALAESAIIGTATGMALAGLRPNIGPLGSSFVIPAINYPEVAILGMGRVQEKPVVRDGEIVARKMLPITLAFDHRIADGADAARFMNGITRRLSDPRLLLLES